MKRRRIDMPQVSLNVELLAHTYNPEALVALASRTCYSAKDLAQLKELAQGRGQRPLSAGRAGKAAIPP